MKYIFFFANDFKINVETSFTTMMIHTEIAVTYTEDKIYLKEGNLAKGNTLAIFQLFTVNASRFSFCIITSGII